MASPEIDTAGHHSEAPLEAADPRSGGERFPFNWMPPPQNGASDRHHLEVRFDNDAVIAGEDRDLFVSRVQVGDRVYAADGGDATYNLADGRVMPGQVALPWNGALVWDVPVDVRSGKAVPVSVFAWGNPAGNVGAHFTVSIDGTRIGEDYAGRVDEMHGNSITGNIVDALAPGVTFLLSRRGGQPLVAGNTYAGTAGDRQAAPSGASGAPRPTAFSDSGQK
jgi:hypothetical protein